MAGRKFQPLTMALNNRCADVAGKLVETDGSVTDIFYRQATLMSLA